MLDQSSHRPSAVPISRTSASSSSRQPLVYPSSFDTASAASGVVVPVEKVAAGSGISPGSFPYGPRALNIETIEKLRRKRRR